MPLTFTILCAAEYVQAPEWSGKNGLDDFLITSFIFVSPNSDKFYNLEIAFL